MIMKKLLTALAFLMPMVTFGASSDDKDTAPELNPETPETPVVPGETKTLVAYFSAQGHTRAVAEAISRETGADIFFIEPAVPYASNPYDDSEKIQNEAYNDLRPEVKEYLPEEQMA